MLLPFRQRSSPCSRRLLRKSSNRRGEAALWLLLLPTGARRAGGENKIFDFVVSLREGKVALATQRLLRQVKGSVINPAQPLWGEAALLGCDTLLYGAGKVLLRLAFPSLPLLP